MISDEDIRIEFFWSNSISDDAMNDFILVQNQVFTTEFNKYKFNRKYKKNIYGPSIIILAYINDKCVGARAFWRNDIQGMKAYQPCDTAVLKEYRRLGIFTKMNKKGLEIIGKNSIIYNFPNDNSLPGYLKMGWTFHSRKRYKLFNVFKDSKEIEKINSDYLNWLLTDKELDFNESLYYTKIFSKYYLLKKRKYNLYVIIAELDEKYILYFKRARFPILLHYSPKGYFGRGLVTVTRNIEDKINIPLYKIDTIF